MGPSSELPKVDFSRLTTSPSTYEAELKDMIKLGSGIVSKLKVRLGRHHRRPGVSPTNVQTRHTPCFLVWETLLQNSYWGPGRDLLRMERMLR